MSAKFHSDSNQPDPRSEELREDMEDLMELRAAVVRNAGKPGAPWEQVKAELDLTVSLNEGK